MKSIWQATAKLPTFPTLAGDRKTEVLIIGGGLAGILTAYFLQQKGVPYILVEKGRICGGTTGNTTAKITVQHGLIYHKILKSNGLDGARMYWRANQAAFEKYVELCREMDCDYEVRDNFIYARDNSRKLEKELEALQAIGCKAIFRSNSPLPIDTVGAVGIPDQAQFHPLKFVAAIAENLNIFENTFVQEMRGNTAVTKHGKIRAEQVIVATHFPIINKHGSYFLKMHQHRSYVLALEHGPQLEGMYVDEDHKGFSFRNYGDFLLLGGGGHRTGKKGGNWAVLREMARLQYPRAQEQFFWAAQDCMSLDDMPYIGHYSKRTPDLYAATGFNKWGMTGAMAAAMILSEKVAGTPVEYEEIFNPSRNILKTQLLVNVGETTMSLLTPTKRRCPHLGCALKWNAAEHSWDCPCHGSRFAEDGTVLDNPANGNMKHKG